MGERSLTDDDRALYYQGVAARALDKQHEYAAAIAGLEMFFKRKGEDSMERFERIAAEFRRETGFLRPGKDCITHEPEIRQAAYDAWVEDKLKAARDLMPIPRNGGNFDEAPRAAGQMSIPEGYRLVPIEPTDKMMIMGGFRFAGKVPNSEVFKEVRKGWDDMLSVAPHPASNPKASPHV